MGSCQGLSDALIPFVLVLMNVVYAATAYSASDKAGRRIRGNP